MHDKIFWKIYHQHMDPRKLGRRGGLVAAARRRMKQRKAREAQLREEFARNYHAEDYWWNK